MAIMDRPTSPRRERRVRPQIATLLRQIVEEDREVYDFLAAYDRGEITALEPPMRPPRREG